MTAASSQIMKQLLRMCTGLMGSVRAGRREDVLQGEEEKEEEKEKE